MLKLGLLHETCVISFGFWVVHTDHWDKSRQYFKQTQNIVQPYFIVTCSVIFLILSCISFSETGQKIDRYMVFFEAEWGPQIGG